MSSRLTCADVEILLADYLDQLLLDAEAGEVKAHLGTCSACAELAADAALRRTVPRMVVAGLVMVPV